MSTETDGDYAAFVSYSHRDRHWAKWLHRSIETYRIPKRLRSHRSELDGSVARLRPVFLDREELPSSTDLASSVRAALARSRYLIVICSPAAAASKWVNEEIALFDALGGRERILLLVVDGDPSGWSDEHVLDHNCFPKALRFRRGAGGSPERLLAEPLAADVREGMDDRDTAKLKLIAAMLGVGFDQLRQRDSARRQKRLAAIATAAVLGSVILSGLTVAAIRARDDARRQRSLAEQKSLTAQRTAEFMTSLFEVVDPGEARGNSITAREILDRGASQIGDRLRDEPLVRAELMTTLGEVYKNLGLYKDGARLLGAALAIDGQPDSAELRAATSLAETQYLMGDYAGAEKLFDRARGLTERLADPLDRARTRTLLGWGQNLLSTGNEGKALEVFNLALASARAAPQRDSRQIADALEGVAQAYFYRQQYDRAKLNFSEALQLWQSTAGVLHPRFLIILNQLGALEYMRGNNAAAQYYYERALLNADKVLGENHPEIASWLNNLARVYLEQRDFTRAEALLERSNAMNLKQRPETHDAMAFGFSNLGLAKAGLGKFSEARQLLEKALLAARHNRHRLTGPILVDLASLDCRSGQYARGLVRLDEARPLIAARYPTDTWRSALVDNVAGACLLGQRQIGAAGPVLEKSTPILLKKWGASGLYGHDAVQRMLQLYRTSGNAQALERYQALAIQ